MQRARTIPPPAPPHPVTSHPVTDTHSPRHERPLHGQRHEHRHRLDVTDLGTILGAWAHPDDETFLSAGVMARAVANGQRVVCVSATAGDQGGGPGDDPDHVASIRRREMEAALAVVGVREHEVLAYRDGSCDEVPLRRGAAEIAAQIERVRPDTILTFGPDGLTGHPDHRAMCAWTTRAITDVGRPVRLLQVTTASGFDHRFRDVHERTQAFAPGLPRTTPHHAIALRQRLDEHELTRKMSALRAHASQTRPIEELIGAERLAAWWAEECFVEVGRDVR